LLSQFTLETLLPHLF